ncbi:hypothetical protein FACS189464_2540 [Bacteroidia bacterium]|nr:hypothetical protein FACS189464_2540 [Bacteroidia bacterium]
MKKIQIILSIFLMGAFGYGCQEKESAYLDDSPAPEPVTVREVVNTNGGAVIRYTLPKDENLLGVKAVYERNGETVEAKASLYLDSLIVEGLGDTKTHDVSLYSIGRNEKLSAPVPVQINPLTPVVQTAQMQLSAAFGGVSLAYNNPSKANLAFELMMIDSTGLWKPLQTFYAGATSGRFSCRGLAGKETKFGVYVRDRWLNKSDTVMETLIPFDEIEIPKDKFANAKLPTDTWAPIDGLASYAMDYLWDGQLCPWGSWPALGVTQTAILPHHFTIDVGYKVALSRFKLYARMQYDTYAAFLPRVFEVWGSDNPPADGSWDNWTRLGRWHMVKPSGYGVGADVGPITAEDREYLSNGADFEIEPSDELPEPYIPITHIRFRTFATFYTYLTAQTTAGIMIAELTFFGQLRED